MSGSPLNWLPASAGYCLGCPPAAAVADEPGGRAHATVVDSDADIVEFPISPQARPQYSLGQHQRSQTAIGIPAKQLSSFPSAGHTWDRPGAAVECLGNIPGHGTKPWHSSTDPGQSPSQTWARSQNSPEKPIRPDNDRSQFVADPGYGSGSVERHAPEEGLAQVGGHMKALLPRQEWGLSGLLRTLPLPL